LLLVTNGLFVYQLFKLVELDTSVTAEEKEELETRKKCLLYLLGLIFIFVIFLFSSVIVKF